jgi:hypothetical protein
LGLTFFGLTSDDPQLISETKALVYKQIHQICFYGQGGYSWPIVYNMPLYLRRFIFNEIKIYHDSQNEQSNNKTSTVNPQNPQQSFPKQKVPTPSSLKKEIKSASYTQYK